MNAEKYFYKEGKWYHFKVVINKEKVQFDLYIDGVKLDDVFSMKIERVDPLGVGIFYE